MARSSAVRLWLDGEAQVRIGYFIGALQADSDTLLRHVAERLASRGLQVCGVVQSNERRTGALRCDMAVRVLPDGPKIGISQSLGPKARGCHLDPDGLERAVALTSRGLTANTAVLILNKFGKHEAEGRGFRDVIATALSQDVPILVKVSPLNLRAFHRFSANYADLLDPEPDRLIEWATSHSRRRATKSVSGAPKMRENPTGHLAESPPAQTASCISNHTVGPESP